MAERRPVESSSELEDSSSEEQEHDIPAEPVAKATPVKEERRSPAKAGVKLKSKSRERGRRDRDRSKERRRKTTTRAQRSRTPRHRRHKSEPSRRSDRRKQRSATRDRPDGSQRPPEPTRAPLAVPCSVCQQPVHLIWQLHKDGMPWNKAVKEANRRHKSTEKAADWGRSWSQASRREWPQGRSQSQTWRKETPEQSDTAPEGENAAAASSSSSGDPRLTALATFYESQASLIRNLGGGTSAPK